MQSFVDDSDSDSIPDEDQFPDCSARLAGAHRSTSLSAQYKLQPQQPIAKRGRPRGDAYHSKRAKKKQS